MLISAILVVLVFASAAVDGYVTTADLRGRVVVEVAVSVAMC